MVRESFLGEFFRDSKLKCKSSIGIVEIESLKLKFNDSIIINLMYKIVTFVLIVLVVFYLFKKN